MVGECYSRNGSNVNKVKPDPSLTLLMINALFGSLPKIGLWILVLDLSYGPLNVHPKTHILIES